jgi:AcrR family transcriptional regulator
MKKSRDKLIDSAIELFGSKGYEATSVHEICKNAGVSKGAFYHYFETKQRIFIVVLENWLEFIKEGVAAAIAAGGTVPDILRRMAIETAPKIEETRAAFPILVEFWRQGNLGTEIGSSIDDPYLYYRDTFKKLLEQGVEEGSFPKSLDLKVYSRLLRTATLGYIISAWISPEQDDWSELLIKGIEIVIQSMEEQK